jgi:hypothetical protein
MRYTHRIKITESLSFLPVNLLHDTGNHVSKLTVFKKGLTVLWSALSLHINQNPILRSMFIVSKSV